MNISILRGGALTTVQDLGRRGHRAAGVRPGGACDSMALRVANLLVGNHEGSAALECTLTGPVVRFDEEAVVALGGAPVEGLPLWKPFLVGPGEELDLGPIVGGLRTYLAIGGGVDVQTVLGGRGTDLQSGWGGLEGRALRAGDWLRLGKVSKWPSGEHWSIDHALLPHYASDPVVRFVPGRHFGEFAPLAVGDSFRVSKRADRMGVRLEQARLERREAGDIRSLVVAPGTIQVPSDGAPIILLADAQTMGGYPVFGHVIGVDLPVVAQLRPGAALRFREIGQEEAEGLLLAREKGLQRLAQGLERLMIPLDTPDAPRIQAPRTPRLPA